MVAKAVGSVAARGAFTAGASQARAWVLAQPRSCSSARSLKRWILPVAVLGRSATNSTRGQAVLDEGLEFGLLDAGAFLAHHEGLGLGQAVGVFLADDGGLQHGRVLHQRGLHLEGADVDAADLEHVVAAAGVGVGAVLVADVLVAALGPGALEGLA
jgi:hypothetical protein